MTSKFPSALTRSHCLGSGVRSVRKELNGADVAMMDAETFKQYAQHRGEWQPADREAIGNMRSHDATGTRGH